MEDKYGKSLIEVTMDWLSAVLDSKEGWAVKRGVYRRGLTPAIDPLISWIDRHYKSTGEQPSLLVTSSRWGDLPWPKSVLAEPFAYLELEAAYRRWDLIQYASQLDHMIANRPVNETYEFARSFSMTANKGSTAQGIELTDPSLYMDVVADVIEVPSWGPAMAERSIHRSDFVLVAARTNVGKSWMLLMAAIDAVQQGWDVVFYSLEMEPEDQAKRLQQVLQVKDAPAWLKKQSGRLHVISQSENQNGFTATDLVRRVEQGSRTLVIIDYGELLRPESGGRATENWNKSAEISQALQNVAKYIKVPVIAAVQDNRGAVGQGSKAGVETLSGSDYWGRHADTALRLRDETGEPPGSGPTRILELVKTRHSGGRTPTFFHFKPEGGGIQIVDRVQYVAIHAKE